MAHFYGSIERKGKSPATQTGTKSSGISTHVRGTEHGVLVTAKAVVRDGKKSTEYRIFRTGGENNPNPDRIVQENVLVFDDVSGKVIKKPYDFDYFRR